MDSDRLARRVANVQIIPYTVAYKEQVLAIGREMHRESIYGDMSFDDAKAEQQIAICNVEIPERYFKMAVRDGVVLGGLLGNVQRTFFNDELIAKDMGWWVTKDRRGQGAAIKLLADFEQWARVMGAKKIMVGQVTERNIEQTTKFYMHLGFRIVGFNTVKDL